MNVKMSVHIQTTIYCKHPRVNEEKMQVGIECEKKCAFILEGQLYKKIFYIGATSRILILSIRFYIPTYYICMIVCK